MQLCSRPYRVKGIGLFLCKNLMELLGGDIYLDTNYRSDIPGNLGSRFVIDLRQSPLDSCIDSHDLNLGSEGFDSVSHTSQSYATHDLPSELSVLFVDDDVILRKLFARTIRTVCPDWTFREASNGETALQLAQEVNFDLIFMDM